MASVTKRDELNVLGKEPLDVRTYFEEMDLPKEEVRFRIRLEGLIEEALLAWLYFFDAYMSSGGRYADVDYLAENLNRRLGDAVTEEMPIDDEVKAHFKKLSKEIVEGLLTRADKERDEDSDASVAQKNAAYSYFYPIYYQEDDEKEDGFFKWLSDEIINFKKRARAIAEDQSNAIANKEQYEEAILSGSETKTWVTFNDELVRKTHRPLHRKTIPIDGLFDVGGSKMRFPMDVFYGAPNREIIRCRCKCEYS